MLPTRCCQQDNHAQDMIASNQGSTSPHTWRHERFQAALTLQLVALRHLHAVCALVPCPLLLLLRRLRLR